MGQRSKLISQAGCQPKSLALQIQNFQSLSCFAGKQLAPFFTTPQILSPLSAIESIPTPAYIERYSRYVLMFYG